MGHGETGAVAALPIWMSFMRKAAAASAGEDFDIPDGIDVVEIDPKSGLLGGPGCPDRITEVFLKGTAPTQTCGTPEKLESGK